MNILLVILATVTRLIPHPYNFTAVGAVALFTGANLKKNNYWVPIIAMLVSDLILGFHATMPYVYGSFALIILLGHTIKNKQTVLTVPLASITASIVFFLVTNFGAWEVSMAMYPHTLNGLIECYIAGIPFFKNTLFGDLVYTTVIFSAYYYSSLTVNKYILKEKIKTVKA